MTKRQRSSSSIEEAAITEYIDACVHFTTNVTIGDYAAAHANEAFYGSNVVVIGTAEQIKLSVANKTMPFAASPSPSATLVAVAASRAAESAQNMTVLVETNNGFNKLTIAPIPDKASRTNCPYRPDAICEVVAAACASVEAPAGSADAAKAAETSPAKKARADSAAGSASSAQKTMDIVSLLPEGSEAAVCKAVASGSPHSFTTKNGAGAKGHACVNADRVHITVYFAEGNAKLHAGAMAYAPEDLVSLMTSVQLCQRLIDTPTNILDTVVFAEIAEHYARELGCGIKIIKGEELQNQGYGGIYAVGKGAQYPPHLVTLHYENKHASAAAGHEKDVALVGKGLVYDCGGLALKPPVHMCNMKTDMGGAAAVFSGFINIVRCLKHGKSAAKAYNARGVRHLSVTLCLAENAIGPNAFRNDDIIFMKSGKSVEVKNTDAEGRICLGDGVHYATCPQSNAFAPNYLIDMATLTGAQGIATGTKHAGIYCNNGDDETRVIASGRSIGDTCFPVLYCPEYHAPQYKSPCADMRNIMHVGTDGGVSCAGYFVEANVAESFKGTHIHVDLAFPTFNDRGATGYGVALLTEYLRHI